MWDAAPGLEKAVLEEASLQEAGIQGPHPWLDEACFRAPSRPASSSQPPIDLTLETKLPEANLVEGSLLEANPPEANCKNGIPT